MDIRHGIDDAGLRELFGLQAFNQGSDLASKGAVSAPRDVYPGIAVYVVSDPDGRDYTVLRRLHTNKVDLLDCDCPDKKCRHIVAVLRHPEEDSDAVEEDDPELIEELEEIIDGIADDITGDPDYDEEANYYDDWYNADDCNHDVEYEHTVDILGRIVCEVADPDTAVILIDRLLSSLSKMEYDNDGVDDAFSECDADICTLFTQIGPETIARILKNRSYSAQRLYKEYLSHVPRGRMDQAYPLLDDSSVLSDNALEMQFERGDYDAYIRCSSQTTDAIFRVVAHLDAERNESAARYAGMLAECKDGYRMEKSALILASHGYREEAAQLYLKLFSTSHKFADFDNVKMNTAKIDTEALLDDLAGKTFAREEYDNEALKTLVLAGRASDVDRYIRKVGFAPIHGYKYYDCRGIQTISRALIARGFGESAAILGRGLIELRLTLKDAKCYDDAVEMMKTMDEDERFEGLKEPHSAFKARMKAEYPKVRKFWGLYQGTWHRSGDRWNPAPFAGAGENRKRPSEQLLQEQQVVDLSLDVDLL